ncbi:MAG: carbohydrate porin, partial [Synechococcaceae cyanobacterium]
SYSVAGYWQPLENGWFPSISAGWGYNDYQYGGTVESTTLLVDSAASQSWYVGLNWRDLFAKGNALGFAVGQPTFITSLTGIGGDDIDTYDGNYAFELYYKFQVTDNIAVTPSLFWLSRPRGAMTVAGSSAKTVISDPTFSVGEGLGTLGGLIQTTFKF